jgi:hypothetical protein
LRPSGCNKWRTERQINEIVHMNRRDTFPHHTSWIHDDVINHIILLPEDDEYFSMRYMSRVLVSVTLIFEALEYAPFIVSFHYRTFAWKLCSFPCFTWLLTLLPSKWSPLGIDFLLINLLYESLCNSLSYLPFFTLHPFFHLLIFWEFRVY